MQRAGRSIVSMVLAVLLGACAQGPVTTTSTTASRDTAQASDQADPERRARVRLELAGLYFGRGQSEIALNELNQALAAKPDLPEAYSLRGLIYASLGDAAQAESSFKRALEFNPRDADVMHNYAWFLCQQKRFDDAQVQFERAVAQPQYRDAVRTWMAQGVCLARAGRWPEAERALLKSYELDPANPFTAFSLSEVLLRRGELERARFYIRRVNSQPQQANAQSLWLAAKVERRLGDMQTLQDLGRQLRDRFPQSAEALQYEQGRFDD